MEIKRREFSKMLGAAVGGVFAGIATGCGSSDKNVSEAGIAANACKGMNACKGQGACAGADGDCAGKNACKGKGYLLMTQGECDALSEDEKTEG